MTHTIHLTRAWAILVGLTVISVTVALTAGPIEGGRVAAAVSLSLSFIKARQVLDHFLELRNADGGWHAFFSVLLLFILGGLMLCTFFTH